MSSKGESLLEKVKKLELINRNLRAHTTHWCPVISSKEIKTVIINRINELGVSAYEVAIRADVSYDSFKKHYIDCDDPQSRPSFRIEDLQKIGKLIGIKIRATVVMDKVENIDRNKLLNDKYIPQSKRKRNRKS